MYRIICEAANLIVNKGWGGGGGGAPRDTEGGGVGGVGGRSYVEKGGRVVVFI